MNCGELAGIQNPKGILQQSSGYPDATIPKGLRPPAQGCEERATLGFEEGKGYNPERVASFWRRTS